MSRVCVWIMIAAVLLFGASRAVQAHETTRSYVSVTREGETVEMTMRVAFRDIEVAVWMDEDLDGRITWAEAQRRIGAVSDYIRAGVTLSASGGCPLTLQQSGASISGEIDYLDLRFVGKCPSASAPLTVSTRLFSEIDPDHRMFLKTSESGVDSTALLSRDAPSLTVSEGSLWSSVLSYMAAGSSHLLGGADHILFLLMLILPAASTSTNARLAARGVLLAVTGFTLAHAVTLTAVTTSLLRPSPDVINVLIALSIAVTAADNVWRFLPAPRAAVAGVFGLIHGFGFASALGALDLTGRSFLIALFGFNFGIEATQIGVVLVMLPALFMLNGGRGLLWLGSGLAGSVGLFWVFTRIMSILFG